MGNIIKKSKVSTSKLNGDRKCSGVQVRNIVLRDVSDDELNRRRVPVYKYLL